MQFPVYAGVVMLIASTIDMLQWILYGGCSCGCLTSMQSQVKGDFFLRILTVRGIATGWTGVDMSTSLLPEGVPGIDADPMLFGGGRVGGWSGLVLLASLH